MLILYCPFDTASASVVESVLVPVCGLVSVTPVVAVPLVAVPLVAVPLVAVPLVAVPLVAVPLVAVPLVAVPLVAVPLVAVPLVAVPVLGVVAVGMFPANRMLPTVVDVAEVDTGSSVMAAALRPEKVTV
jgi:hypothetical protein